MKTLRIVRVRLAESEGRSPKMIGSNSRLPLHGQTAREWLYRIETDAGLEGVGRLRGSPDGAEAEIRQALGADPRDFYTAGAGVRHSTLEYGIWDLIGKLEGQPVYRLLGRDSPPRPVDAYDGSLYFCDLLYPERGLECIREEARAAVQHGFQAIKMKVGRGYKWMDAEAGFRRDVEAVRAAREAIGPDVKLMVDGNNGFDLDGAIRLFEEIGEHDIYWAEEMFPETEADCARFREFLSARGFATLIADGETQRQIEPMLPIHAAGLIDVQQLDINVMGLTGWSRLCRDVLPRYPAQGTPGGRPLASPHTWPSQFGVYVSAHLAAAYDNVLTVEVPPYAHAVIVPRGIEWRGGQYHFSGEPGLGLAVDEREWNATLRAKEIVYA